MRASTVWRRLVRAMMADGLVQPSIAATAPFDLIVANILASPLTMLAPQIARFTARGRHAVAVRPAALAGKDGLKFLPSLRLCDAPDLARGPWSALLLERPVRRG